MLINNDDYKYMTIRELKKNEIFTKVTNLLHRQTLIYADYYQYRLHLFPICLLNQYQQNVLQRYKTRGGGVKRSYYCGSSITLIIVITITKYKIYIVIVTRYIKRCSVLSNYITFMAHSSICKMNKNHS